MVYLPATSFKNQHFISMSALMLVVSVYFRSYSLSFDIAWQDQKEIFAGKQQMRVVAYVLYIPWNLLFCVVGNSDSDNETKG